VGYLGWLRCEDWPDSGQPDGTELAQTMQLETEGRSLRMNYALTGPEGSPNKGTIVGDEATNLAQGVVQSVYGIILRRSRLDEAEDYHLISLAIREEIGDRVGIGRIYGMLSVVYSSRGEYEQAIQAAQQAREIAHETADRLFEATSLAQLADAEKTMGDLESARRHYLEGKAVFQEIQDRDRALQSDLKLAELQLAAPLVGVLAGHEPNVQSLKTQARFAFLRADSMQAVKLMTQAKELAGDHWSAESEKTLQNFIEGK